MTAYAIGHLTQVDIGPAIAEYIRGMDATLEPYQGRFLIHGNPPEVLEGEHRGDLIIIAFPDIDRARQWYASPAYQAILPLRRRHAQGTLMLVEGMPPGHRSTDVLAELGL